MPRIKIEGTAPVTPAPPPVPPPHHHFDDELARKSGHRPLAAFLAYPDGVSFQGEEENENIILLLRQHPITTVPWIVFSFILILVPIFIFPFLFMTNIIPPVSAGFKFVGTLFWYLATSTYILLNFLYWYFNVYIVTNENVVDIDWFSLTYRRVVSAPMSKIQDTSVVQGSVLESVFDYGNVHVETAGEMENIEFERIPHPALVKQKIDELMQKEEKEWEK